MRIAITIYGEPRFCKDLDLFLERLVGYDQVDWFVYIWEKNQDTSDYFRTQGSKLVAPFWQNVNPTLALEKMKNNLPAHHNVIDFRVADQNSLIFPEITNHDGETNINNFWKEMLGHYKCDQLRQQYEQANNFKYDMVFKSRPDLMIHDCLDCAVINPMLQHGVVTPNNTRCGYGVYFSNIFAIANSDTMSKYSDAYNQAKKYHDAGCIFHPETLIAKHLTVNGISYNPGPFNVDVRQTGRRMDNKYFSEFGRWE
jgi:hypothetical protein